MGERGNILGWDGEVNKASTYVRTAWSRMIILVLNSVTTLIQKMPADPSSDSDG
jgi:hypothetical protein